MGRFDKLTSLSRGPAESVKTESQGEPKGPSTLLPQKTRDASDGVPVLAPVPVPDPVPSPLFKKRLIVRRYPVDPFEDQITALDALSSIEKAQGLTGSRAAMVRDALDLYFVLRPLFDAQLRNGFRGTITDLLKDILQASERAQ
jgi:hypothetical protein